MVSHPELALLRTRWTEERARSHPQVAWIKGVPYAGGRRLLLQGEETTAYIEPIFRECDPRISIEGLYDRVKRVYLNITKDDIRAYLKTVDVDRRRKQPVVRGRPCTCSCHGEARRPLVSPPPPYVPLNTIMEQEE